MSIDFSPPPAQQSVRIVMKNAQWFDFSAPEGFKLIEWVTMVRAAGYVLNPGLYVPVDQIQAVFMFNPEQPPATQGVTVPFDHKVH